MSRWPPDSAARLKASALALFAEHGFAAVTASEVAAAAGMSQRTFFRHFKAKEDVLFEDYSDMRAALTAAVADAPPGASPRALMQAVADLLESRFTDQRAEHRVFASVVGREPHLRARAALRDQDWGEAVAEGFSRRGFGRRNAALLAALTTAVFRLVYDEWLADEAQTGLADRFAAALAEFDAVLEPKASAD
jgi:AcrR family transcriptional regulator